MQHVFLETNWLYSVAGPAYGRTLAAVELLDSARHGRIRIYVPACCIGEAKKTIRLKSQPKEANRLRSYVQWAVEQKLLEQETAKSAMEMLSSFEGHVTSELARLTETLREITRTAGVEIVPLNDDMLRMSVELNFTEIKLTEFDRAVLAAVLIKGRSLRDGGETDVNFCGLDSDLLPWQKKPPFQPLTELKKLYDDAGVRVYSDFTLPMT